MARSYIQVSGRKARHETRNAQHETNERHFAMITLSVLGQLDLIGAATGNVPAAASELADPFVFRLSIFVLAVFVGYYVVWSVTPALHTPLMSVTNAISSVIVVGALIAAAAAGAQGAKWLGLIAVVLASVNIFGGFAVTARMLAMYKKRERQGDKTRG